MNEIITYNLNSLDTNSDEYYDNIKDISSFVCTELLNQFGEILDDYMMFQRISSHEKVRTKEEYGLEVLLIGVLWNSYIEKSLSTRVSFLNKIFNTSNSIATKYTLENFKRLIEYIESTKEFNEEKYRIEIWHKYLYNLSDIEATSFLKNASSFSIEFTNKCDKLLGKYLPNLDIYLKKIAALPKAKKDFFLCSKNKEQYYLNMVGAEIMNSIFSVDFRNTRDKMIILPGCMVLNKEGCQAELTNWGYSCSGCTFNCPVNKINRVTQSYNVNVYIVHHESDLYKNVNLEDEGIGIIGIACVLNLLSGGWKAKRIGLTPQCVLLDYCGCRHWHESGIITSINLNQLLNKLKHN